MRLTAARLVLLFVVTNALKNSLCYLTFQASPTLGYFLLHFIPALLLSVAFFLPVIKLGLKSILITAYIIQVLYLEVNVCYYYAFHNFIHLNSVCFLFWEEVDVIRTLSFDVTSQMLLCLIDLPIFVALLRRFREAREWTSSIKSIGRIPLYSGFLIFCLFSVIYVVKRDTLASLHNEVFSREIARSFGLVANNIVDFFRTASPSSAMGAITYGKKTVAGKESPKKHSIVMIQVESLDANLVDYRHRGKYITPYLHQLANKSIYYQYTLTYRRAGGSSDCELSILNNIEPVFGYPTLNSKFYLFPNAFPKRLQARGFATRGFHGNVGSFYNRSNAYLKMGFQDFYDIEKMGLSEEGWGAADSGVYEYVLKRMAEERQPFFYYVITMSSHEKFTNVNNYYNNPNYDDIPYKMTRNYLNSMTYTDRQLKIFVEQITSRYPDTYIFIFGDHTPYVINSGPYRRSALSHDQMELEFVPLFILTPQQTVYQEKSRVAGFLDITPTVITASGVETSLQLYGTDLFKFPITEDTIHYRSKKLNREMLFRQLTETACAVAPHLYP